MPKIFLISWKYSEHLLSDICNTNVDKSGLICPYSFERTVPLIIHWIIRQDPAAHFHFLSILVLCSRHPKRNEMKIQVCWSVCRKKSRSDNKYIMFWKIFIIIRSILAQRYKEHVYSYQDIIHGNIARRTRRPEWPYLITARVKQYIPCIALHYNMKGVLRYAFY